MAEQSRPGILRSVRTWVIAAAAVVLIVVIAQNTAQVETRVLFMRISMPRALLLAVMLTFGFVLGFFAARRRRPAGEG